MTSSECPVAKSVAKEEGTKLPYEVGAEAERLEKRKAYNIYMTQWDISRIGFEPISSYFPRNIPIMLMPIESMLLAVNLNFLVFSVSSDDMMGQSFASLVSTVAAAESAIGLAIFVITFRVRGTIAVESINSIQG